MSKSPHMKCMAVLKSLLIPIIYLFVPSWEKQHHDATDKGFFAMNRKNVTAMSNLLYARNAKVESQLGVSSVSCRNFQN